MVTQFDDDGISVRFINADSKPYYDGLKSPADVAMVMDTIKFEYGTKVSATGGGADERRGGTMQL